MVQKYLEQLVELIKEVEVDKSIRIECRRFFGGAAAWVNGKIFASLSPAGFALKLPEKQRMEYILEKGAKPLRYFPKSPIKKEYVIMPKQIIANNEMVKDLIKASVDYTLS